MKKIILCLMATGLLLTFHPFQSKAAPTASPSSLVVPKTAESAEVKALLLRLNEIKAMDKSTLKSSEKKELRKEVLTIKHELRDGGVLYISGAGLLLIIILLILLV